MKSALIQKIGFYIVLGLVVIFPLFFLPVTSEFYEFNKQFLLLLVSSVLLILLTISFVIDKQVKIVRNPFALPILAIAGSWIISTISRTPNRLDAIIDPGQTGSIVALAVYFFTATHFVRSKKDLEMVINGLVGSFTVLGLISLAWGTGVVDKIAPWTFAKTPIWTPSGSPLTTLLVSVVLLPFLGIFIARLKENSTKTLALSVSLFILVVASGLISYRLFRNPANRPIFLSQGASWSIAMEALKTSPLVGTGANTYLMDFTRFKPLSHNLSTNWAIRFSGASNYYLQTLTTIGIFGLVSLLYLAYKLVSILIRSIKSSSDTSAHTPALASTVSATLLVVSLFFIPPTLTTLFLFFTLLIVAVISLKLMGSSMVHEANIDIIAASDNGIRTPILPWVSLLLAVGLILPQSMTIAKAYYADVIFQSALSAATRNDGRKTYEGINNAIKLNPFRDVYRMAASQTDLLLANSAASTKEKLSDNDRTVITQLVQQSIQEAKNAVALNPTKVTNVENLALIYQNLLNFAQGADQWSVASYQQAITLDPSNPNLRIALGGIFFSLKNYDEAIKNFQLAADLKPNFANAYYNMAAAYKEKKDYQSAYTAMQVVVNLTDKTSADYLKAKGELDELAKMVGKQAQIPAEPAKSELEAPKPLPSPKVNPPITLPSDLGPETTPTVTPTPKVTTTPAP